MKRRLERGMRLVVASHNPGKVREIRELVAPHGLSVCRPVSWGCLSRRRRATRSWPMRS
jgi:inosine/xanthosine triphosphate pyrophosphatase family protein